MIYNAQAVQYASKHLRPMLCSDYGNGVRLEHKQMKTSFLAVATLDSNTQCTELNYLIK